MLYDIQIPPYLMDIVWDFLDPDIEEWLKCNNIWYEILICDEQGRMFITLSETDAIAFKLRWM